MKNSLLLLLLFLSYLQPVYSQQYFSRVYDIDHDAETGWKISEKNGELYVFTGKICMNNTVYCSGLIKLDGLGNELWKMSIDSLDTASLDNMLVDDYIYCSLYHNTTLPLHAIDLLQYDLDGNLVKQSSFSQNNKLLRPIGVTKNKQNELILSYEKPRAQLSERDSFYFVKLDTNLNVIENLTFNSDFQRLFCTELKNSDGNNYVYSLIPDYLDDVKCYVHKIDSAGNPLWQKELPASYSPNMSMTSDTLGNSYIAWQKNYWVSWDTFEYPPVLIKLDKDGNQLWEYPFYSTLGLYLNGIFVAKNGDIIGCGTTDDLINTAPVFDNSGAWIFRISPDGVLKWRKSIADLRIANVGQLRLLRGAEMPNNDLVFCGDVGYLGELIETGPADAWVIRTDSMGCITPECGDIQLITSSNEPSTDQNEIEVYPNPAIEQLSIRALHEGVSIESVSIFDALGKEIITSSQNLNEHTTTLNLSAIPAGFYFVTCVLSNQLMLTYKFIKQ